MIYMIWCQDLNGGISKNNKLPWNIPEEMQHFINVTKNKNVVMGRKTYESIGHPLKNRHNIVVTNTIKNHIEGIFIFNNINDVLEKYRNQDLYIIGGVSIYEVFFKYADVLIISYLNNTYDCDRFVNFDLNQFRLVETIPKNGFIIKKYERIA